MEKTIQKMKESGLFDSIVDNILHHGMPKDAVDFAIDQVCQIDRDFEDIFFNDIHNIGLDIIWKTLCAEVEKRKSEDDGQKEEAPAETPAQAIGGLPTGDFEQLLMGKVADMIIRKCEDMIDEIFADVLKNNK